MSESPLQKLTSEIWERRILQWMVAYLAGAWVVIEATTFLTGQYGWGDWVVAYLTYVLGFGIVSTVTIAWFHGAAGGQRVSRFEAVIHGIIAASLLTTLWLAPPETGGDNGEDRELQPTRVAVLYFKDHSQQGDLGPLASDLTEAVVHRLAQVPALDVLPLTAVEAYRGRQVPFDSIVEALRAGSLVEGSITRLDDELLVTAQLIEGGEQVHEDSWVYARPVSRRSTVVTEVADSISAAVRATIGDKVLERRVRTSTTVPQALALYRRAQAILSNEAETAWREDPRSGVALLDEADRLLARAERLDPDWIEPIILRIEAAVDKAQLMGGAGSMDQEVLRDAIDHADRALDIAEDSAPLLERRGYLRYTLAEYSDAGAADTLYAAAEADFRVASRFDDQRPRAWWGLSQIMKQKGSLVGAYEYARRAYEADSFMQLTGELVAQLTDAALQLERIDEAREWCVLGRRLFPRDQRFAMWRLAIIGSLRQVGEDDIETAWAYVDTVVALGIAERAESWRGYGQTLVAVALATAGQVDSAEAVIDRAGRRLENSEPWMQGAAAYFQAVARLRMGQEERALSALVDYVEQYPSRAETLAHDWWFRELWDDPRFIDAYGGTPTEAMESD